jgi:hypothetical protein
VAALLLRGAAVAVFAVRRLVRAGREGAAGRLVRAARGLAVEGFMIAKIFGCAGNEKSS